MMWKVVAAALAFAALNDVAFARDGDEECIISDTNACAVEDLTPSALDQSTLIFPGGDTRCAFDDWSNTTGTTWMETNATYFFQVFPTDGLDKTKLFLYLQGGGACFDDLTCNFALQCSVDGGTFYPNARALSVGVLNRSDPDNLFNDWNIVHLPYCTGDLHVGNKTNGSTETGIEKILGYDECLGQNMSIHQVGYVNSLAALTWALENYPEPEHIVLGGSSAGSMGAQILSALVADMWQVEEKSIKLDILADSYVGALPDSFPGGKLVDYYGTCDVDLKAPASIMSECNSQVLTVTEMMSALMEEIPTVNWLFIDSKYDHTQRYFYQMIKEGILHYPFPDLISGEDFYSNMTAIIDAYKAISDKVSTFYIESEQHVYLTQTAYYNNGTSTEGDNLGKFITQWLASNSSLDTSSNSGADASNTGSTDSSAASVSAILALNVMLLAISFALFQ